MPVKLIAENILTPSDFLSATEQEGEHIGQPAPDSANTGNFRLLSKGDIRDFTYSGTATSDGTTLTIIDAILKAFGDSYFVSGEIEFTGGENTSGTKTITAFAQATGTLTWVGAVNSTLTGDTFTLTVSFASRDFKIELIGSGDAGDATFKWAHDGTTYLGRDDPLQANWLAAKKIADVGAETRTIGVQAANGDLLVAFTANDIYRSTDKGLTWTGPTAISIGYVYGMIVLKYGPKKNRIMFSFHLHIYYSDDHGETWAEAGHPSDTTIWTLTELPNSNLLAFSSTPSYEIRVWISKDGGFSWSEPVTIASDANNQLHPQAVRAENGDIVCAYYSDEDDYSIFEIKCKISKDGGATWGNTIDVLDYTTVVGDDYGAFQMVKDVNGTIILVAELTTGTDDKIVLTYSIDNGETWDPTGPRVQDLKSVGSVDLRGPSIFLVDGHCLICAYIDNTNDDLYVVRRGIWEAYSANACPCAIEAAEQKLINDVGVPWHGGGGIAGDKWTFGPEYRYAMSNLIEDSPSKPWRSEQDNIACNIVIDLGANERYWADGIGLFGCNIRTCSFQMNATDSWGSPSIDESISFDLATGTVDVVDGNYIKDTSLLANYKDHELKAAGLFLRMTSGTDDTLTWKIKDNVGDYIVLDTTAATNIAATDTFVIFQGNISKTFTGGLYRYINIAIAAQHTADDYYRIGSFVPGKTVTLSKMFKIGWSKDHRYDIDMIRSPHGGLTPIKGADRKRILSLTFPAVAEAGTQAEIAALLDYVEGKNITLIPDDSDMKDCYLVKHIGDLRQRHRVRTYWDLGPIMFEEIL